MANDDEGGVDVLAAGFMLFGFLMMFFCWINYKDKLCCFAEKYSKMKTNQQSSAAPRADGSMDVVIYVESHNDTVCGYDGDGGGGCDGGGGGDGGGD